MPRDGFEVVAVVDTNKPASILIVEDEALVSSYIREVLESSGFHVAGVAASAAEALSHAAGSRPDLALIDIRLTGPTDGIELACQLRERFQLPAIFLSGLIDKHTIERAKAAEPLGFLKKPFLPSQVFNAIEEALASLPARPNATPT